MKDTPSSSFVFATHFETYWKDIYQEYLAIKEDTVDWVEEYLFEGGGWKVYGLFDFPNGNPIEEGVKRCPITANLIRTYIPNHKSAGFSILKGNTKIKPHRGYQPCCLRYHLGLDIPQTGCGIKISGTTHSWNEGKSLVFNDHFIHEAWNTTPYERVILLVDFISS